MVVYVDHIITLMTNIPLDCCRFFFPILAFTIRIVAKKINYSWCGILYSGIISGAPCSQALPKTFRKTLEEIYVQEKTCLVLCSYVCTLYCFYSFTFLVQALSQNGEKRHLASSCTSFHPYISMEQLGSLWTDFHDI